MPRRTDPTDPADWIAIAEADLAMVRLAAGEQISFGPCRSKLAEALEKILKAELIRLGWSLERTHDLQRLAKLLEERGSDLVTPIAPLAVELTEAYFADRYPGFDLDDPDWPHLARHIEIVGRLLALVRTRTSGSAGS